MTLLQWIIEGNINHYVKTRVNFTVDPRPAQSPARRPQNYYLPARARPGPASFRPVPGPARIISLNPGPAHGLRAGLVHGPRPDPCRTLPCMHIHAIYPEFKQRSAGALERILHVYVSNQRAETQTPTILWEKRH